jgi:hypothetical protein
MAPPAGCSWRHFVLILRTSLAEENYHVSLQNLKSRANPQNKIKRWLQPWRKNELDLERNMSAE